MGQRVEFAVARLASLYVSHYSKSPEGVSPYVFAPHHDEPELTVEQAMELWT